MAHEIIEETKTRMEKSLEAYKSAIAQVRTGRANASLVNNVEIDYYGTPTPIYQVSNISIPEARQILIKPYDRNDLRAIETAIINADLNVTPLNDGQVIRINIPALTEEKRKALVKEVYGMAENAKVAIRNIRRDMNTNLKKQEKEIPEDQFRKLNEDIQKQTDEFIKKIDEVTKVKEKELLTV